MGAAADSAEEMPDQAARCFRREQYRRLTRPKLARAKTCHGALRRLAAYSFRRFQCLRISRGGVPVVPLHALAVAAHYRTGQTVAGTRITADKAMGIAVCAQTLMGGDGRAFRIVDSAVEPPRSPFTDSCEIDGLIRFQVPGMAKIEIRDFPRHESGFRQSRARILGGVPGDATGRAHTFSHRGSRQIGRARGALAPAEIHRNTEAVITLVLKGFDLAQTHGQREPRLNIDARLRLTCALGARLLQDTLHQHGHVVLRITRSIMGGARVHGVPVNLVVMARYCKPMNPDEDISARTPPSKSQRKRDMEALQALGVELVQLSAKELAALSLPESLLDAIAQARLITSHGAMKRQRQLIGRLMRGIDADPVRNKLHELRGNDRAAQARFHRNERWRDRLITDGDAALTEFLAAHPQADPQHLRRLVRDTVREGGSGRPRRHFRDLFRYIQSLP